MGKASLKQTIFKNQVALFVFSAGSGALVDVLMFRILHFYILSNKSYRIFKVPFSNYSISLTISFFMGVMVNFLITRYLVFTESKSKSSKQFVRFMTVAVVGYFANLALIKIFIQKVGMDADVARISTLCSLFFASFFVHKVFSFSLSLRHHHATGADSKASN
jgi:putative flippase GtrA